MTKQRKYKIKNKKIAEWFGYSSERSYNSSSAKAQMEKGINQIIQHVEIKLINQLRG